MVLELLTEFVNLGWDDLAVGVGTALQVPVVLMVVLRRPEVLQLADLRHDWVRVQLLLFDLVTHLVSLLLLLLVGVEDRRLVLSAHVVALPIERSRIVHIEKYREQV